MKRIGWQSFRSGIALVGMAIAALSNDGASADAKLGNMVCTRIAGTGYNFLITSSAQVRCTFKGGVDAEQWYIGKTGVALGVDLKWNKEEKIFFGILLYYELDKSTQSNHYCSNCYF